MTRRQKQKLISLLVSLLIVGVASIARSQGWLTDAAQTAQQSQPGTYAVSHFVDGDTIDVDMSGQSQAVRFIGVDTPETHKPNTPIQCYGPAAAAYTKHRIGAQRVRLVADSKSSNRDRYNRLLRYVYLPDGTLLNQDLIENGYGFYYPYFPFSKSDSFAASEQRAMAAHKGLWGNCSPHPTDSGGYSM